jgi:hypothetical protein
VAATVDGTPYALPPPEEIRHQVGEILQNPKFSLESPPNDWWEKIKHVLGSILDPVLSVLEALFQFSPVLYYLLVVVLAVLAGLLIFHIIYTIRRALQPRAALPLDLSPGAKVVFTPEEWEQRARLAIQQGDFLEAVRCLFQGSLQQLREVDRRRVGRGRTNREILRRFRETPVFEPLARFVETLDWKYYGHDPCTEADVRECLSAYEEIRQASRRALHA